MATENLPSEFDVVILGTGLPESVVAAACARVGQRVLHLDKRSYYAGNWASFTFNGLLSWIEDHNNNAGTKPEEPAAASDWSSLLEEGEEVIPLSSTYSNITNLQVFCYTCEEDEEEEEVKSPGPQNTTEDEAGNDECTTETTEGEIRETEINNAQVETPDAQVEIPDAEVETPDAEEKDQAAEVEGKGPEASQQDPSPAESQSEPIKKKISYAQLLKEGRRFNIDLVSKMMYSRGPLVELLIKSNVSRYAEFKNVTRILTYRDGKVEQVPCSRADVFASRQLSVVEKRMLMKFLTFCLDYEEHPEEYEALVDRPYLEFLRTQKLTANLQHFLVHSIAMATEDTPTGEGLSSTRHFLRCLGRYGNTPFLFPLYGLGEIPQCFCRMCAVFGGIYCLRHSVDCLVIDKQNNKCKAVIDSQGQRISCSHFVVEDGCVGAEQRQRATPTRSISRAVLITDRSILPSESEQQVSLVNVPPVEPGSPAVRMVELCSSTMTCMPNTYLVHLTCQSSSSAFQDLSPVVTRMFLTSESQDPDDRPRVLWCLYFNMEDNTAFDQSSYDLPSNVYVCSSPDSSLASQNSIKLAESIFQKVLPDEDFCPPAPNPEDIIYDGEPNFSPQEEGEREGEERERGEGEESERGEGEERERGEGEERERGEGENREEEGEAKEEEEGEMQKEQIAQSEE